MARTIIQYIVFVACIHNSTIRMLHLYSLFTLLENPSKAAANSLYDAYVRWGNAYNLNYSEMYILFERPAGPPFGWIGQLALFQRGELKMKFSWMYSCQFNLKSFVHILRIYITQRKQLARWTQHLSRPRFHNKNHDIKLTQDAAFSGARTCILTRY